jgi:hypothetical protein
MKYAKKIQLSSSTYRLDPNKNKLIELETELNKILSNKELPSDEKVKLYQNTLTRYLEFNQQSQITKNKPREEIQNVQKTQVDIKDIQKELEKNQKEIQELYKKNIERDEELKKYFQNTQEDYYDAYYDDFDDYSDNFDGYYNKKSGVYKPSSTNFNSKNSSYHSDLNKSASMKKTSSTYSSFNKNNQKKNDQKGGNPLNIKAKWKKF